MAPAVVRIGPGQQIRCEPGHLDKTSDDVSDAAGITPGNEVVSSHWRGQTPEHPASGDVSSTRAGHQ